MKLMELYRDKIMGAIRGLDRIRFRGTLRLLANQNGLRRFMSFTNVLLKDFSAWAEGLTAMITQSCLAKADELGIETHYLRRASIDKRNGRQILCLSQSSHWMNCILRFCIMRCTFMILHRWCDILAGAGLEVFTLMRSSAIIAGVMKA